MKEAADRYPDWDLLLTWIAVAESGSISEAAKRLRISQAGVSQRIKALEQQFDTALLDRTTRPARLTAAGQRLFEHTATIMQNADQMVESVRNVTRAKRAVVRLGCVDSFAATLGPTLIRALAGTSHQIRLWSGITPVLDELLEQRQLDISVTTSGAASSAGIRKQKLFSEPYVVALPRSLDLPPPGTILQLSRSLPLIRYSARSMVGQDIDTYLSSHADLIERTCEFDTTDPVLSLVTAGLGFAITTPLCIWQSRHYAPDLRIVPLSTFNRDGRPYPVLTRSFYIAFRDNELGSLPTDLTQVIKQSFERQLSKDLVTALKLGPAFGFQAGSELA